MPYVERDEQNKIIATYGTKNPGIAEEYLSDTDVEVLNFRNPTLTDAQVDAQMDAATGVPEMLSILEAIADRLPGPVSVAELRADAKVRGRVNIPRRY